MWFDCVLWKHTSSFFRIHLQSFHASDVRHVLTIMKLTTYVSRLHTNNNRPQERKKNKTKNNNRKTTTTTTTKQNTNLQSRKHIHLYMCGCTLIPKGQANLRSKERNTHSFIFSYQIKSESRFQKVHNDSPLHNPLNAYAYV